MERLTMTSNKGGVALTFDLDITCEKSEIMKILKLAERLKYFEDLEEQGLLKIFPCKAGTKVYMLREDIKKIINGEVTSFRIGEFVSTAKVFITDDNRYTEITFDNFGKKVFLAQAEAEEALKGTEAEG